MQLIGENSKRSFCLWNSRYDANIEVKHDTCTTLIMAGTLFGSATHACTIHFASLGNTRRRVARGVVVVVYSGRYMGNVSLANER